MALGRWHGLWLVALVGCGWWTGDPKGEGAARARRAARDHRPNVLLVVLDTVRADRLSAWGHARDTSPRLEALAAEGTRFSRAVSPGIWTVPSHASLFTGLDVAEHGVHAHHKWLDDRFETLAEVLSGAGYATWLMSANPFLQKETNLVQGFTVTFGAWRAPFRSKATEHTASKLDPRDASSSLGPAWSGGPYESGRGMDHAKDLGPIAAEALGRWAGRQRTPWFAFVNLMEAHTPRVPSAASRAATGADSAAVQAQLTTDQSEGRQLAATVGLRPYEAQEQAAIAGTYDAAVRDADAALGAIVDRLDALGVLDDTLVIVTSDHGEHLGESGLYGHKFSVRAPLVHVPLVVRLPGRVPVAVREEVVSTASVMPTVLGMVGRPVPQGVRAPNLFSGSASEMVWTEMLSATPRALQRLKGVHPGFDDGPWLAPWIAASTAAGRCLIRHDGHREAEAWSDGPVDDGLTRWCDGVDPGPWRATQHPYDPEAASEADREAPTLSPGMRERLEALGYVDP